MLYMQCRQSISAQGRCACSCDAAGRRWAEPAGEGDLHSRLPGSYEAGLSHGGLSPGVPLLGGAQGCFARCLQQQQLDSSMFVLKTGASQGLSNVFCAMICTIYLWSAGACTWQSTCTV